MTAIRDLANFNAVHGAGLAKLLPPRPRIAVGMGTCGTGNGAEAVMHAFAEAIQQRGLDIDLVRTGCFGFCAEEPLVNLRLPGQPLVILHRVRVNNVDRILDDLAAKTVPAELALCRIEDWNHLTSQIQYGSGFPDIPLWNEVPFFRGQKKIVLRNAGLINPDDIEEYIAVGGYQALYKVLIDGDARGGQRSDQAIGPARARRRRLFDGPEMGVFAQGQGRAQVPDLQRRRRRSRRLHEPQRDRKRSARADRGHGDRRLYHGRDRRRHLHPRRIPTRRASTESGHRAGPRIRPIGQGHSRARLFLRYRHRRGGWRFRMRRGNGADRLARRTRRASPPTPAVPRPKGPVGLSDQHQQRRNLVQHRPYHRVAGRLGSRKPAAAPAPAPRSSPWSARCATPGSWKCRSARHSAPSSTRSAAAA